MISEYSEQDIIKLVKKIIKKPYFTSKIYKVFFRLSRRSYIKFNNIAGQARMFAGALKLILEMDSKPKEIKTLKSKMKDAHTKHKVTIKEFKRFRQAIIICFEVALMDMVESRRIPDDVVLGFLDEKIRNCRDSIVLYHEGSDSSS